MFSLRILKCSLAVFGAALLASNASADLVVSLSGLDYNTQFNANGSSVGGHAPNAGSAFGTQNFTVTGLDITGDGSANDTAVFSYDITTTGGVLENIGGNAFSYGVDGTGDPADNEIDPTETISFSNLNAAVTLGDSNAGTISIASAEFIRAVGRFVGGDTYAVTGSGGSVIRALSAAGSGNEALTFSDTEFTYSSTAGNGYGVDSISANFDLRFTAVPEPSSLALLGLGGIAALSRRRRR